MSKLRNEEKRKKKSHEATERLLAIGEEGREGVKAAKEVFKQEEEKDKLKQELEMERLEEVNKRKIPYNGKLCELLADNLADLGWPFGWTYYVAPTEKGVVMELKSPRNTFFRAAFKSIGDVKLDFNAIKVFTIRAQETIDKHTTWTAKT